MLETLFDAFVDVLHAMPSFRRILLLVILAAALWFKIIGWNGFVVWSVIFVGFELMGFVLPHKR